MGGRLPPTIHKLGLKWAIFSSFTLALLIILGALYFIVPKQVEIYLLHRLEQRADAVAREVRDAIAQTQGRGHIVTTGCVMPTDTPEANIRAAIAAAREA